MFSELFVEDTIENSAWYTVKKNHISLITENAEKIVKFETDVLDNCMIESTIELMKVVASQNGNLSPLKYQVFIIYLLS